MDKYKVTKNIAIPKSFIAREKAQSLKNILTFHDHLPHVCSDNRNCLSCKVVLAYLGNWNCQCIYSPLTFSDIKYLFGASKNSGF